MIKPIDREEENIKINPFLATQKEEVEIIEKHGKRMLEYISKVRPEINTALTYDLIIKAMRMVSCNSRNCDDCPQCNPEVFMKKDDIIKMLKYNKYDIKQIIDSGLNNSYNLPERGLIFQNIIDRLFNKKDNIVVCEIGCGGGLIGRVLTNSNYSREFFSNQYSDIIVKNNDQRNIKYYGIDPNLLFSDKDVLMMINGQSDHAKKTRLRVQSFLKNEKFNKDNILLDKMELSKNTVGLIENKVEQLLTSIDSLEKEVIFISSVVRYHLKEPDLDDNFVESIKIILGSLYKKFNIRGYYLSKEMYGKDGKIYPSRSTYPYQFLVKSFRIGKDGSFGEEVIYPEFGQILI